MPRSNFTPLSDRFRKILIQARKDAGLTQLQVAKALRRPQSHVSDFERGQRRLDIIEFLEIARVLKADPHEIIRKLQR